MKTNQEEHEEFSLREILLVFHSYWEYFLGRKWIVGIFVIVGMGISCALYYSSITTYTATLTFMVNEEDSSSIGGVGSLLGQFGLGADKSRYNLDKILYLSKSSRIIGQSLLDSTQINGKDDKLANHIIEEYDLHADWKENANLKEFKFESVESVESDKDHKPFNTAMKILIGKLTQGGNDELSLVTSYEKNTGILSISCVSLLEEMSIACVELVYLNLEVFYVEKSTEQKRRTLLTLSTKVDSLKSQLNSKEAELARISDRNTTVLLRKNKVYEDRLFRDLQIDRSLYSETLRNYETTKFLLDNSTPVFQKIELPGTPIFPNRASFLKLILISVVSSAIISLVILSGVKTIQDALRE